MNLVTSLIWLDSLDLKALRVLQELRDAPDQEALKADGDLQALQGLTESPACLEIQERQDPQDSPPTLGAT